MRTYSIWDRENYNEREITEKESNQIISNARMYTGNIGYMGEAIDIVLCSVDDDSEPIIEAVHYKNEWLSIPDRQSVFMSSELGAHAYDPNWAVGE